MSDKILEEILLKVEDQAATISLLEQQLSFQKDRIDSQDRKISELNLKVETLSAQQCQCQNCKKDLQASVDIDVDLNDAWNLRGENGSSNSILEAVKETAEKTLLANLGFVFDPGTKLYCNYSTGYYYDPAQQLFYNGHTRTYYTYDADNQRFVYHSKVEEESTKKESEQGKVSKKKRKRSKNREKTKTEDKVKKDQRDVIIIKEEGDIEEGELSSSIDQSESESSSSESGSESCEGEKEYPPCIRAIVTETSCPVVVKKGTLFLITCMGGSIGRTGSSHAIILDDTSVDELHARITYLDQKKGGDNRRVGKYCVQDLGSVSGTFLNGTRLSEPSKESELMELVHGSTLKVGGFSLLLHIHPGSFTCGHCEPGLIIEEECSTGIRGMYINDKSQSRNSMLKAIKKKYGVDTSNKLPDAHAYHDRAGERRVTKGSDNPYEKTLVASVEEAITEENKGFKMLAKMGWKSGDTLGTSGVQGLVEPIKPEIRTGRSGLGVQENRLRTSTNDQITQSLPSSGPGKSRQKTSHQKREDRLSLTVKRFKEAEEKQRNPNAEHGHE